MPATDAVLAGTFGFDGMTLEEAIAEVPVGAVASYGTVTQNGIVRSGEMWFIVNREKRDVYYHLSDVKEAAKSDGNYQSYRILAKAQITQKYYAAGQGASAPLAGNTTDAFAVSEWKLYKSSIFTTVIPTVKADVALKTSSGNGQSKKARRSQPTKAQGRIASNSTPPGTPGNPLPGETTTLDESGTLVQTMKFPPYGASPTAYTQSFSTNGTALGTIIVVPFSIPMATSDTVDCAVLGANVEANAKEANEAVTIVAGTILTVNAALTAAAAATVASRGKSGAAAGIVFTATENALLGVVVNTMGYTGNKFAAPFYGWAAEQACLASQKPDRKPPVISTLKPPDVLPPGAYQIWVCLDWSEAYTADGSFYTDQDGITVAVVQNVPAKCNRWDLQDVQ